MLLKPLKRAPLPSSASSEIVEPSAGLATAFIAKLREFPGSSETEVQPHYFSGLRVLICLFEDGKPFLPQLINHLSQENAEKWPITVQEDVSVRQSLDDIDAPYLARVVDYFLDMISTEQMTEINAILRDTVWTQADSAKN